MAVSAFDRFAIQKIETRKCETHGDYKSEMFVFCGRENWTSCPLCQDEKRRQDEIESQQRFAREQEERRIQNALRDATIPRRFADASFESYVCQNESQRRIYAALQAYAANFPEHRAQGVGMIMTGGVGTGKTHLAVAIARHVIHGHKMTAKYASINRVMVAIKSSFHGDSDGITQQDVYEILRQPDLLILDEVGAQQATEFEKLVMFDIVNARYEDVRPTILISNLSIKQVAECVGDRVIDRLRENGGKSFVFDWNSYRR